ncbi:MAG: type II secretion system protein GspD, partial [Burkholderiales bacterium]
FLETQGNVSVLSSPRIATLNNQKAVLKVGQDELFVTNISSTTTATGISSTTAPTVTLQSFFSGIALDVTPQIDEDNNIILHIHPSVSNVQQVQRDVRAGGSVGTISIPVPRSAIQETDSVIRAQNGQIVAIGGLISQSQTGDRSQVPVLGDVPVAGNLFANNNKVSQKRELVILLKPTVIQSDKDWQQNILETSERIKSLKRAAPREASADK